jgi:hypothetical protein
MQRFIWWKFVFPVFDNDVWDVLPELMNEGGNFAICASLRQRLPKDARRAVGRTQQRFAIALKRTGLPSTPLADDYHYQTDSSSSLIIFGQLFFCKSLELL